MKQLLTITLLLVLLSCGQKNKSIRSELLTSSIWTIKTASVETLIEPYGEFPEIFFKTYKFLTDGTCHLINGETEIYGQWRWTKDDEIYIKPERIFLNGKKIKNDRNYGLNMEIIELTDKTFRTLESVEADHRNSGIILEGNYTAISL